MKLDDLVFDKDKQLLVDEFLSGSHTVKYILGRNECAEKLSTLVDVDAYIDDFTKAKEYLGKPVISSSELDKRAIVVSCSIAIYPHSALATLESVGVNKTLHFLDLLRYSNVSFNTLSFIELARKDIELNYDRYEELYETLSDDQSKNTFLDLLNFRKNLDVSYLSSYKVDFFGQYFEDFLKLEDGEVFVDAGGFDGATSIEFIKHCPSYQSIHIFEPSIVNINSAKENLKHFQNIHYYCSGLFDKKGTLKFDSTSGSASSVSEEGDDLVHVDKLDDIVMQPVTFIKMDIEGGESKAIEGMSQHILNDHPKLAISVYHKPDDLWKISKQILDIRSDYDLYIRHYTEGTDETVMFFIPV